MGGAGTAVGGAGSLSRAAVGGAGAAAASVSPSDAKANIFESGYKPPPATTASGRVRRTARATVVVILAVLGILCLTLSPLTIWGRNLILNTDRYVDTLKPIVCNPGVQNAIVTAVDKQVNKNIDVSMPPRPVPPPPRRQRRSGLQYRADSRAW